MAQNRPNCRCDRLCLRVNAGSFGKLRAGSFDSAPDDRVGWWLVLRFPKASTGKRERPQLLHKRVRVFCCRAQQSSPECVAAKNVSS